jgi:hypothetical protein
MTWNELNVKLAKLLLSCVLLTALLVGAGFVGVVGYCCLSEMFPRTGPEKKFNAKRDDELIKDKWKKYEITPGQPSKGLKAYFEDSAPGQSSIPAQRDSVKQ